MTTKKFLNNYDPTIEDFYSKKALIHYPSKESAQININILDTAGQSEYSALREQYIKSGEGFILVYDITSRGSFFEAALIHSNIRKLKGEIPCILVGNKIDIAQKNPSRRQVTTEEGFSMAQFMGSNVMFAEISTMVYNLVQDVFIQLLRLMQNYNMGIPSNINPSSQKSTTNTKSSNPTKKDTVRSAASQAMNVFSKPIMSKKQSKSSLASNGDVKPIGKKSSPNIASFFSGKRRSNEEKDISHKSIWNDNVKPNLHNSPEHKVDNYFSSPHNTNQPQGYDIQQLSPLVCAKTCEGRHISNGSITSPVSPKTHFPHVQPQAPSPLLSVSHTNTLNTLSSSNIPVPESFVTASNEEVPKTLSFLKGFRKSSSPVSKVATPSTISLRSASDSSAMVNQPALSKTSMVVSKIGNKDQTSQLDLLPGQNIFSDSSNIPVSNHRIERLLRNGSSVEVNDSETSLNVFKKTLNMFKQHLPQKFDDNGDLPLSPLEESDSSNTPTTPDTPTHHIIHSESSVSQLVNSVHAKTKATNNYDGGFYVANEGSLNRPINQNASNNDINYIQYTPEREPYVTEYTQPSNSYILINEDGFYEKIHNPKFRRVQFSDASSSDNSFSLNNKESSPLDQINLVPAPPPTGPVIDVRVQKQGYQPLHDTQPDAYYPPLTMKCI